MGTPSSSLRPPPEPARTAIVDSKGYLTKDGWWFLYLLFRGAQNAEGTAILEAIDAGTEDVLLPRLSDLAREAAVNCQPAPGVSERQLEEAKTAAALDPPAGVSARQLDEVRTLGEVCGCASLLPRLQDLERLVATLGDQPATVAATTPGITGSSTGPVPPGGTGIPPGTPTVLALPLPSNPLSVVGQTIIFNGVPWVFVAPLSGAGSGYWQQVGGANQTIQDTRANRGIYPAANYPVGTAYFETDTKLIYVVQVPSPANVPTWVFYNGIWSDVYANLPTLGIDDRWLVFTATDYVQSWVWNGTAWNFAPGSSSGYFLVVFPGITTLPPGLWAPCNGATVSVTQNNATLSPITTPVVANQYIRQ
jgi:hypothetical protein